MKIDATILKKIIREELAVQAIADAVNDEQPEESGDKFGHGGSARMAKSHLFHIAKNAQSLHDKLDDEDELPEWAQGKIAVMKSMIDAVHDHLDYKMVVHDKEEKEKADQPNLDSVVKLIANLHKE